MKPALLSTFLAGASLLAAAACGPEPAANAPVVHAMPAAEQTPRGTGAPIDVHPADGASLAEVAHAMGDEARRGNVPCYEHVFVWGSLRGVEQARPMRVASGGATLAGFVLCKENMPEFLAAQRDNPRLAGARSGSGDLRWADGQFYLRRSWGNGEAPLGDLSSDETAVLQKGELLAAVFEPPPGASAATPGAPVVAALARVPKFFLFGMWPLPVAP